MADLQDEFDAEDLTRNNPRSEATNQFSQPTKDVLHADMREIKVLLELLVGLLVVILVLVTIIVINM